MALTTTTIGAYPKPGFLPLSDWFAGTEGTDTPHPTEAYETEVARMGAEADALFAKAAAQVIGDQVEAGIDIPTDGEVRRENYIHYHCRHLDGIDFQSLTKRSLRTGNYQARLPTITGPVRSGAPFLDHDWRVAQAATDKPLKMTLPGPMTIGDTVADAHYGDGRRRGADLAETINKEVHALAAAGCRHIQIDEPVFARKPLKALDYGFEHLERCFHGLDESVVRSVHMCCGYPSKLDEGDYPKAPLESYSRLAPAIEASSIQAISIEDAHRYNDLTLLEGFTTTTVIFGAITIATSRLEPVEEIAGRLRAALEHIDAARLMVAPDCGLGYFSRDFARAKLANMCTAARQVG